MKFKLVEAGSNQKLEPVFTTNSNGRDYIEVVANQSMHFMAGQPRIFSIGVSLKCTNLKAIRFVSELYKIDGYNVSLYTCSNNVDKRYTDIYISITCPPDCLIINKHSATIGYIYPIDGHLEYGE